jgi:hypothetical protein
MQRMDESTGLVLVGWNPLRKNSLRGFATIRLHSGLTINENPLHVSHTHAWASLPSKPMLGAFGAMLRDCGLRKARHGQILEWSNRTGADRASVAVVAAIECAHPGVLDDPGEQP